MIDLLKTDVDNIIKEIYDEVETTQSTNSFIMLKYNINKMKTYKRVIFERVIPFLPNTKFRGIPFIISVSTNKGTGIIEIIAKNIKKQIKIQ